MRQSPVHQALRRPRLNYGIGQQAMALCWGPAALVAVLVGSSIGWFWALLPVAGGAFLHSVLQYFYKKDWRIFELYAKYSILADSYHPHAREHLPPPFERPAKVGRGLRL